MIAVVFPVAIAAFTSGKVRSSTYNDCPLSLIESFRVPWVPIFEYWSNEYKKALRVVALACGGLYLGYLCILYFMQSALIYPGTKDRVDSVAPQPDGADLFHISTTKGNVDALFLPADAHATRQPAVIFGYGNGEVIDYWVSALRGFQDRGISVLLVEYPGYGRSTESPSEQSGGPWMRGTIAWPQTLA
jgi:hypothetical protein